jgi:hypothetical protein
MITRVLIIVALLFLTACGGGSTDNPNTPNNPNNPNNPPGGTTKIKKLGTVALVAGTTLGQTTRSGFGVFFEYPEAIDVPKNPQFLVSDSCTVTVAEPGTIPPENPNAPTATSLDAGDALTLESGEPYATLPKSVFENVISYASDPLTPLLPFPSSLTLDIPGATNGFPAFQDVAFPGIPAEFTLTQPSDPTTITKAATFAWTGAASSDSFMQLFGSGQGTDNKTVGFYCLANDDGNFSFPAQTQSELDAAGFTTGSLLVATRSAFKQQLQGDAALFVTVGLSQTFISVPQ